MRARGLMPAVAAIATVLALAACASSAAEPPAPSASAMPSNESTATPTEPAPTSTADPLADWQTVATADGIFRWRIPADWSVVDESFEAEDDLGWVNAITVVSDIGQELAYFGSAYYGDRGGLCGDWDGDGTAMVPAQLHFDDPTVLGGDGRVVAYAGQYEEDTFRFFAGFTLDDVEAARVSCPSYSDVPVDVDRLQVSFGTTFDDALWRVESFEQGAAYTETEEFDELIAMFRSLEVLEGA